MNKTYACTDIHGRYDLFCKIQNYLNLNDTCYCLGDCADRGPDGIKIYDAIAADDRFILIKGNHEEFLQFGVPDMLQGKFDNLWIGCNGGNTTWETLELLPDNKKMEYVEIIKKLPITLNYINKQGKTIVLNHCGFTPGHKYEPLWDRAHFLDKWREDAIDNIYHYNMKDTYIVHGHTPVQYMGDYFHYIDKDNNYVNDKSNEVKILRYAGGHKFDIDLASCTSNKIGLLDLDTFEEIYFSIK